MNPTDLFAPAATAWLGDALLQSTLVLALALLANCLLARRPAAWRHALLLAAAIAVPLLFVFSAILPAWKLQRSESLSGIFEAKPVDAQQSIVMGAAPKQPVGTDQAQVPTAGPGSMRIESQPAPGTPVGGVLLLGWLLGTLAILVRLGVGIVALARIRATTEAPPELLAAIAREARRCGLESVPRIVFLESAAMPMTWRIRRHVIALPSSAAAWSDGRLRRVLRHEFAHIQRDDCRTSWLAEACLASLWFHPFAWRLRRELDHTRELASDDLALGRSPDGPSRDRYARDLLEIISKHAQHRRRSRGAGLALALAMAMANRRSGMRDRLDAILDPARDRRAVSRRARRWVVPVWLVGIAGVATLGACRTTQQESPQIEDGLAGEVTSHVAVQVRAIEVEDGAFLENLFRAEREGGSFTGVVSADELGKILAKLRARGAVVKSMPTIVTRYGKAGTTEQMREVIYPSEYDPPEVAAAEGGTRPMRAEDFGKPGGFTYPVTPANPTAFETREIGFKSTVQTGRLEGGRTRLGIAIEDSQYLGVINYGSPIYATAEGLFGRPVEVILTENRIEQPVFRQLRLNVDLDVPPGASIAIVGFLPDANRAIERRIDRNESEDTNRLHAQLDDPKPVLYLFTPRPYREAE